MRTINLILIHCSATPEGRAVSMEEIRRWHIEERGFRDIGYHFVIEIDGRVRTGRPLDQVGAHCVGRNRDSIGICYVGGMDAENKTPKDTRTPEQKASLFRLLGVIGSRFPLAHVRGHRDVAPGRACPSYDVKTDMAGPEWQHWYPRQAAVAPKEPVPAAVSQGLLGESLVKLLSTAPPGTVIKGGQGEGAWLVLEAPSQDPPHGQGTVWATVGLDLAVTMHQRAEGAKA